MKWQKWLDRTTWTLNKDLKVYVRFVAVSHWMDSLKWCPHPSTGLVLTEHALPSTDFISTYHMKNSSEPSYTSFHIYVLLLERLDQGALYSALNAYEWTMNRWRNINVRSAIINGLFTAFFSPLMMISSWLRPRPISCRKSVNWCVCVVMYS